MLAAILDCLVAAELKCLVDTLKREGVSCLSSEEDLDALHEAISQYSAKPIVIYGPSSMNIPYDDCPRVWLCCGPESSLDIQEARAFYGDTPELQEGLRRREKAERLGYRFMTYIDTMSFLANELARQCVKTMNLSEKAADIMLRHVKNTHP